MAKYRMILMGIFAALLVTQLAVADDIDLFKGGSDIQGSAPNILFVVDNGASWNSNFGTMKASQMVEQALYTVLTSSGLVGKVNVGVMTFSASNSPKGGKVIAAVEPLTAAYQAQLSCELYNTTPDPTTGICPDTLGDEILPQTNNSPYALTLNEAYLYYSGDKPASGIKDGVGTPPLEADPKAFTDSSYSQYLSPDATAPCARNFIIFIGTGTPDSGENTAAYNVLYALGGVMPGDPLPLSPSNYQSSWGDEFARYLSTADVNPNVAGPQSITTYVVDVIDSGAVENQPWKAARAYFKNVAKYGKGSYFAASSADQVATAIQNIMNQVESVNTVFASVSLPISVNVQGTNLNQVYIGMFRPDSQWRPRWMGNLKRYQYLFDPSTNTPYLADVTGAPAYNPASGFINDTAVSYWTKANAYWGFDSATYPNASDSADGATVEKGGAGEYQRTGYNLPVPPTPILYTCAGGCSAGSTPPAFDTGNTAVISAISSVTSSTGGTPTQIVDWAIGQNVQNEDNSATYGDTVRPSVQGDVLHSRPAVVNYATGTHPIVVFYGSNDGFVRAVDGATGQELWGFIPSEQISSLVKLYDDTPMTSSSEKPYFVDGNISVITEDVDGDGKLTTGGSDKVYLYLTMRRGGRLIYAFDVTDPTNPKFMWKHSSADPGFAELAETWSTPKPAFVRALSTTTTNATTGATTTVNTPVLIFGAGYDAQVEDQLPSTGIARTMGRGIYMLNAVTGDLFWDAGPAPSAAAGNPPYNLTVSGMTYSIPSDVTIANTDGNADNWATRVYVGDTGGNVWRVDVSDPDPSNWTVTKLASVGGCTATAGSTDCRKFLYAPSVVLEGSYQELLMGSGDREHPFDKTVTNRFYMFKDNGPSAAPLTESDLLDVTNLTNVSMSDVDKGWYITLTNPGEKVVGNALTLNGITYFNTTTPPAPNTDANGNVISCASSLGTAREYFLMDTTGMVNPDVSSGRSIVMPGGGYPPPPIAITLINPYTNQPWTGVGGLNPVTLGNSVPGQRRKTFWFDLSD